MAYDTNDRAQHRNGDPGYFAVDDANARDYYTQYSAEPRDKTRQRASSNTGQPSPPPDDKMTPLDRTESLGHEGVSPELIAAIAEQVKKEVVEHLKQTGTIDDQFRAPPMQRTVSDKSSSTSSPPPTARNIHTPPSPTQASKPITMSSPATEAARSPPTSPLEKPSGVRFSDRPLPTRPGPSRTYSTMELSTIDQKWGRLFDNEGNPTPRLGQFLRGLGNHLIDDFTPKNSIVVTPSKMAAYYGSHALENELNALVTIFRAPNEQISQLYQDLGCQYHLVQDNSNIAPTVPALTPVGFAQWMTIHILAYPDQEAKRLDKVVLAMPIDADGEMVDGKPERLPKQISRHLLPATEDRKSRKLLEGAISDFFEELGTSRRHKTSITSPSSSVQSSTSQPRSRPVEIPQPRSPTTASKTQPPERDRKPYTGTASVASESSSNDDTIRIERERKPYTAQPGSGKVYAEAVNAFTSAPGRGDSGSRSSEQPETAEIRNQRTQSNSSDKYIPPIRISGRRNNSPPFKSFSNSTPGDIGGGSNYSLGPSSTSSSFPPQSQPYVPASFVSSSSFPSSFPPPPPEHRDLRDRDKKSRDDRPHRRPTEDEGKVTSEFISPREAERWDRFQDIRAAAESERLADRTRVRGASLSVNPQDPRSSAAYDDWNKERGRGAGYDAYVRY